jgi:hypothetical protein
MLLAAGRRFGILFTSIAGGIALCSLAVGLLGGFSLNRALANGFEAFGALMLLLGFFVGNRGPVRLAREAHPLFGPRFLRWATPEEHRSTIPESAFFMVVGLLLILIGLVIDDRYRIV